MFSLLICRLIDPNYKSSDDEEEFKQQCKKYGSQKKNPQISLSDEDEYEFEDEEAIQKELKELYVKKKGNSTQSLAPSSSGVKKTLNLPSQLTKVFKLE
jgi:hypothetical protein